MGIRYWAHSPPAHVPPAIAVKIGGTPALSQVALRVHLNLSAMITLAK